MFFNSFLSTNFSGPSGHHLRWRRLRSGRHLQPLHRLRAEPRQPGMEFLDINLTKKRLEPFAPCYSQSHLLYWYSFKQNSYDFLADFTDNHTLYSGFINPLKKSAKHRKLEPIHY